MSKKDSYDNKYFNGYDTYYSGIIPLYIRLPKNDVAKCCEDSKNMVLLVHDKDILKIIIWYEIELTVYLKKNLIIKLRIKISI